MYRHIPCLRVALLKSPSVTQTQSQAASASATLKQGMELIEPTCQYHDLGLTHVTFDPDPHDL